MTDQEIINIVAAHQEGKRLQARVLKSSVWYQPSLDHHWVDEPNPKWNFENLEYRIAPEPRKPREWVVEIEGDNWIHTAVTGNPVGPGKLIRVREVIE